MAFVSIPAVRKYCEWLTVDGAVVRLPTKDEWQQAAKRKEGGDYWEAPGSGLERWKKDVWYLMEGVDGPDSVKGQNSGEPHQRVMSRFGLVAMYANVAELADSEKDGKAQVIMGGSWRSEPGASLSPLSEEVGFRVVLDPHEKSGKAKE